MSLPEPKENKVGVVLVLGTTRTLAWASTYCLPAILADRISDEPGMSSTWFFAAFSASLVVALQECAEISRITGVPQPNRGHVIASAASM